MNQVLVGGGLRSVAEVKQVGTTKPEHTAFGSPVHHLQKKQEQAGDDRLCEMLAEGFLRLLRFREERKFAAAANLRGSQRCTEFKDPASGESCSADSADRLTDPVQAGKIVQLLLRWHAGTWSIWIGVPTQETFNLELEGEKVTPKMQPQGGALSTSPRSPQLKYWRFASSSIQQNV